MGVFAEKEGETVKALAAGQYCWWAGLSVAVKAVCLDTKMRM